MDAAIRNPVLRFVVYSHLWLALGRRQVLGWEYLLDEQAGRHRLPFLGTIVFYAFHAVRAHEPSTVAPASP
jgi:hypothetical protein